MDEGKSRMSVGGEWCSPLMRCVVADDARFELRDRRWSVV